MKTVEINDAVDCDFFIAEDRPHPSDDKARVCPQCGRQTWVHTAACMWCGHDRRHTALRWLIGATCVASVAAIFTLKFH